MMVVSHNIAALNANRQLNISTTAQKKSSEKLSSGYRINRAADDAAGLSISEKMRAQIRGLDRGVENIQEGISFTQVADGALNEVHNMLQRMNELAVKSANGTNSSSDRQAIDDEMQRLKTEMQRVFTTTTFNEKQVWPEEGIIVAPKAVGTVPIQAVRVSTPSNQRMDINNSNYDKLAVNGYTILANRSGVSLSWMDYDGEEHVTNRISWNELKKNGYSFQVADYFDPTDTELFDGAGQPVFDFGISLAVEKEATIDSMIKALDQTHMRSSSGAYISANLEDENGTVVKPQGITWGTSIVYSATYAARENANISNGETGYDYNSGQDAFFEAVSMTPDGANMISGPTITDVTSAKTCTQGWSYAFELDGIGAVTATSSSVSYSSSERSAQTEGIWWRYYTYPDGRVTKLEQNISSKAYGNGTLGSVMDALTGSINSSTPGLLSSEGVTSVGGTIALKFDLKSNSNYAYGESSSSNSIGSFTMYIDVTSTDTEETVLKKIKEALNSSTKIDLYTSNNDATGGYHYVYKSTEKKSMVDRSVYQNDLYYQKISFQIHAGPSTEDKVGINYRCLRLGGIGLQNTNVLTEKASMDAIRAVEKAIELVSKERSLFGAYQNRLEHARDIDENTAENTTAAESRIRDTDMAEQMVEHAKENILVRAGQAMLAQANTSTQGVLSLIK